MNGSGEAVGGLVKSRDDSDSVASLRRSYIFARNSKFSGLKICEIAPSCQSQICNGKVNS